MAMIKLVDTTLRDGGLVNDFQFTDAFAQAVYRANAQAGVAWMEFGYRADKKLFPPERYGKWKYATDEDIRAVVGEHSPMRISVMCEVGRCDYRQDLHPKVESPVDIIRVATYLDDLPQALQMMDHAKGLGYEVTCNLMAVSRCERKALEQGLEALGASCAMGVYVVDSFGALVPKDIRALTELFLERLEGKAVGIHAHNNMQCAFANTLAAMETGATLLDGSAGGMGRGAGNCPMELLAGYLGYPIEPLLGLDMDRGGSWGYNTSYLLTGLTDSHPASAIAATAAGDRDYGKQLRRLRGERP